MTVENVNPGRKDDDPKWLIVVCEVPYDSSRFGIKGQGDLNSQKDASKQMSFYILPYSTEIDSKIYELKLKLGNAGKMVLLESECIVRSDNKSLERMIDEQTERQYLEILDEGRELLYNVTSNVRKNVFQEVEIEELDEILNGLRECFNQTLASDKQRSSVARFKVEEVIEKCQKELVMYTSEVDMQKKRVEGTA